MLNVGKGELAPNIQYCQYCELRVETNHIVLMPFVVILR